MGLCALCCLHPSHYGEVTWHQGTSPFIQETAFCINPLKIPDKDIFEPENLPSYPLKSEAAGKGIPEVGTQQTCVAYT